MKLNRHVTFRTGLDLFYEHTIGHATAPILSGTQFVSFPGGSPGAETQDLTEVLNAFDGAYYLEGDFTFGPVTLTPGLRVSYIQELGHKLFALDPRLWVNIKVTPRAFIKGSVGLYSQRPDSTDLLPAPFGNPNLGPERAVQTSLGAVYRHEVTSRFFGWLSYTLSRSVVRTAGDPTSLYVLGPYDQTHILSAIASYKLPWWGLELGGRFRYVTGNPTTPVLHPYDIYNADSNRYTTVTGPTNSARLKPFQQLDLRLEKSFLFKSWTLSAYVDVQNVYNYNNTEATLYDYRFRNAYSVPGIPILPVIGARGTF
jgi:hypothetical protein